MFDPDQPLAPQTRPPAFCSKDRWRDTIRLQHQLQAAGMHRGEEEGILGAVNRDMAASLATTREYPSR